MSFTFVLLLQACRSLIDSVYFCLWVLFILVHKFCQSNPTFVWRSQRTDTVQLSVTYWGTYWYADQTQL